MSTDDNSTEGSTSDGMRKAAENLDHEAGGAPSSEYLDKVDPDDFGRKDETGEDQSRNEDAPSEDDASTIDSPSTDR
ncbi:hypothetical protein ACU4IU_13260 [Brevibacterium sp. CSND-B09]|uniref:hypothetical protein n=1 Tax=Brevibacterium sp. CSND-B09 TaxID=3462571 RepID=UPI00406AABA8